MSHFKVEFDALDWQHGRPGMRQKVHVSGTRQIRLVEFETSDGFEDWCTIGHMGYVLAGGLQIEFDGEGEVVSYVAGDGIFIPTGQASAHRAVAITPGTRLIMVEDV